MGLAISPLHVRRSTFIRGTPTKVWKHFETFEAICGWLDAGHQVHVFEPHVGGTVDLSVAKDGPREHFGGEVLVVEPARELSFAVQWHGPRAMPVPNFWTFRLTPLYDGTMVEILHHGFDRLGAAAGDYLEAYEAGWDNKHLLTLRSIVESTA